MAAFTAAGLSLVNVAITARTTRRGHREQWRREQERPIVARCLTLSAEALREWWDASVAREGVDVPRTRQMDPHWDQGRQLVHDLRYEVAQLDLLASGPVRQAALDLVKAHEKETTRLLVMAKPGQSDYEDRLAAKVKIEELQGALVESTRIDLGLGPASPARQEATQSPGHGHRPFSGMKAP